MICLTWSSINSRKISITGQIHEETNLQVYGYKDALTVLSLLLILVKG